MATANLFETAKVLPPKATAGKKPAKNKTLIEGLETYAAIDHTIKSLTAALATAKVAVMEVVTATFISRGASDSFEGVEGLGSGNIQCRKRSAASGLTDIEQEICIAKGIPTETVSDRPEAFLFNPTDPACVAWLEKNAVKLSKELAKLGAPINLITKQEATTKVVTTEESLPYVFRTFKNEPEVIAELLPVVATLAIRAKFDGKDSDAAKLIKAFDA